MNEAHICYSGSGTGGTHQLGSPHYSYRFAEEKFRACLDRMGLLTHKVEMPEYYSTNESYKALPDFDGHYIHLIFRSTEAIRILKSGYNIVCYAWEFPHLKDSTEFGEHPFFNQKRMLALCEEVWVPCKYTKSVLDAHGLSNTHVIPAPITTSHEAKLPRRDILARIGHIAALRFQASFLGIDPLRQQSKHTPLYATGVADARRRIFLSIFNPEDFRKNLDAMVRGFDMFTQGGSNDILIIKALTDSKRFDLHAVVQNVMLAKLESGSAFDCRNIVVINALLSDEEMMHLYDLADFYLCTSIAEGQNLPLLEAMARGVVPITTRNTAMIDYIDDANAVIIPTTTRRNTCEHLAGNIANKPYDVEICSCWQVYGALKASETCVGDSYKNKSKLAGEIVEKLYSPDTLQALIWDRLQHIAKTGTDGAR